jgi:hypothetical protein
MVILRLTELSLKRRTFARKGRRPFCTDIERAFRWTSPARHSFHDQTCQLHIKTWLRHLGLPAWYSRDLTMLALISECTFCITLRSARCPEIFERAGAGAEAPRCGGRETDDFSRRSTLSWHGLRYVPLSAFTSKAGRLPWKKAQLNGANHWGMFVLCGFDDADLNSAHRLCLASNSR